MEPIYYDEAASLLGVKINTINQAIERGVLTRAGRNGRSMFLMKEQVMLFTGPNRRTGGKKRLSVTSLATDEYIKWQSYQKQALQSFVAQAKLSHHAPVSPLVSEEAVSRIVEEKMQQLLHQQAVLLEQETDSAVEQARAAQAREERFRKAYNFPLRAKGSIPA